jgi:menaquinone-dependent protoporphyrinogen oxidase
MRVLVTAASKHGSTWDIARAIGDALAAWGVQVDIVHVEDVDDLSAYDAVVLGSAVYAGRWLKQARAFVEQRASELARLPVWLFSSGPIGSPTKLVENRAVDIRQIAKLIRIKEHRILAGRLNKRRLDLAEKVITMAMRAPKGDFRNWEEIHAWADGIAQILKRRYANSDRRHRKPISFPLQ